MIKAISLANLIFLWGHLPSNVNTEHDSVTCRTFCISNYSCNRVNDNNYY